MSKIFEVTWREFASIQVRAETEQEAEEKAMRLAEEDPLEVSHMFDELYPLETEEVPV